jgi:hypothetical protein
MSEMRPELPSAKSGTPCPTNGTAYLMVYNAVRQAPGLIWGKTTDAHGAHCAIGWTFAAQRSIALPSAFIDEVAMVNDSVPPTASPRTRRLVVLRWLRWKLKTAGMPGFAAAKEPQ